MATVTIPLKVVTVTTPAVTVTGGSYGLAPGAVTIDLENSTVTAGEPDINDSATTTLAPVSTIWVRVMVTAPSTVTFTLPREADDYWLEFFGVAYTVVDLYAAPRGVGTLVAAGTGTLTVTQAVDIGDNYFRFARAGAAIPTVTFDWAIAAAGGGGAGGLTLTVLTPDISQTPGTLVVSAIGAPDTDVTFDVLDGTTLLATDTWRTSLSGTTGNVSVALPAIAAGTYTVLATQGTDTDSGTFTVALDPFTPPSGGGTGTPPTTPTVVNKWVFQDKAPGGLGEYVLPYNPETMSSPWATRTYTTSYTTTGVAAHTWEGSPGAREWTFTGVVWNEAEYQKIVDFADLDRRFYVIDHRLNAWTVSFTRVEFTKVPDLSNDWLWRYTVHAVIFDGPVRL